MQAPVQPLNDQPEAGVAFNVTWVREIYVCEHVPGQLMKPSVLVTVPLPATEGRQHVLWARVKAAAAERFCVIVSLQEPVPEQAPLQPVKLQPSAGVAFNVTCVLER